MQIQNSKDQKTRVGGGNWVERRFRPYWTMERCQYAGGKLDLKEWRYSRWENFLPEVMALAVFCTGGSFNDGLIVVLPVLIRAVLLAAIALHGIGHALAAGTLGRGKNRQYLRAISIADLIPFSPIFIPGLSHPKHAPRLSLRGLSPKQRRSVAIAGPICNALLFFALTPAISTVSAPFSLLETALTAFAIANLLVLLTSWTDYKTFVDGLGHAVFCGNFGILAKRVPHERGFLPKRFRNLVEQLGRNTDIRGQQAGGMAVLAADGHFIGQKILNEKRGDLTRNLVRAFDNATGFASIRGIKPLQNIFHLVAHYRYATSGGASLIETHWHRWLPPRSSWVWRVEGLALVRHRQVIENLITHNGDFDAWNAPWGRFANDQLGTWLDKVLAQACQARGDSPKIAGMVDLLITEGQWEASLRLAYAQETGQGISPKSLKDLAEVFEQTFKLWAGASQESVPGETFVLSMAGSTSLADIYRKNANAIENLRHSLHQASLTYTRSWPDDAKRHRQKIISDAIYAFFHNDLFKAAQLFMARAEGTFGLVITSSLYSGAIVLCAERQPLFIGADPDNGILLYASEAAALKNARCQGPADEVAALPYRYDLRDGDIVYLQVNEGSADSTLTRVNGDTFPETERITPQILEASALNHHDRGWISLRDNPCIELQPLDNKSNRITDRVLLEMRDIPLVLDRIRCDWENETSLNRKTANAFSRHLLDNACKGHTCNHAHGGPSLNLDLDLLVIGIENNFSLGQRFVADLHRVFPFLHVQALDAISFCEDPGRYDIGPGTTTLALSQSGQTFNTLDAVKFMVALNRLDKAGPVFVMTGEVDTLMGDAVGQSIKVDAPWNERVFSNGAGWRTAEPATVTSAAIHATLTQLLMRLMLDAQNSCKANCRPFGLIASDKDVARLDTLTRLSIARSAAFFGQTAEGWEVESPERERLLQEGHYLSGLLIEPSLVFIASAIHLFAMLWAGWNPVIGLQQMIYDMTSWRALDTESTFGSLIVVAGETAYFLFSGVAFTMLLRWWHKRPLWDRFFVARTLVIGEDSYVKDLLAQYVSKLFSLAYEFAGFAGIHAADASSGELLHGYAHRITRGLILFLGVPDGRWSGRERAEAAVCMTSSQVRGVQNMDSGATVIGLGYNDGLAGKFNRFVHLDLSAQTIESSPWSFHGEWSQMTKDLQETRFVSFERLLASYVIFHSAAARTRDFMNRIIPFANFFWAPIFWAVWVITLGRIRPHFRTWNLSRTQSGTRIATTASPVSAINLDPKQYLPPTLRQVAEEKASRQFGSDSVSPKPTVMLPQTSSNMQENKKQGFSQFRLMKIGVSPDVGQKNIAKELH